MSALLAVGVPNRSIAGESQGDSSHPYRGCGVGRMGIGPLVPLGCCVVWLGAIRLLFSLPALSVGVPNAVGEQAIEIGKVWITVDEEVRKAIDRVTRPRW
jgi:hypothetical protein